MPRYTIQIESRAQRAIDRLSPSLRRRVSAAIDGLADDPRPRGSLVVMGRSERTYRIRVSEYRVLYEIHDQAVLVRVVRVAHRKDAYGLREHEEPYGLESAATA